MNNNNTTSNNTARMNRGRNKSRSTSRSGSKSRPTSRKHGSAVINGNNNNNKNDGSSNCGTNPCQKNGSRLRLWLFLITGSCYSVYSLYHTIGGQEALSASIIQKEMELEGLYLASLFRETAHEAAVVLGAGAAFEEKQQPPFQPISSSSSNHQQQQREALATITSQSSTNRSSHNNNNVVDFTSLDPSRNHAIVIPYRDRTYHLEQFIEHMGPYLARNFPDDTFELWLIEQDDKFLFNRAWLVNVGIASIQAQNKQYQVEKLFAEQRIQMNRPVVGITVPPPPTCITLHDVDLIPTVDGVPYTNCSRPIQLGSELAHFNNSIPYPLYTGGVGPSMLMEHWEKINGMSNDFFGWGGEDDELWHRLRLTKLLKKPSLRPIPPNDPKTGKRPKGPKFWPPEIVRPPKGLGRFRPISEAQTVHHNHKSHNQWNRIGYMLELMQNNSARWQRDGLSDMRMTVTGDATTITHMDSIETNNATNTVATDKSVVASGRSTTTTFTRKHYVSAKQRGSIISSLSIDPSALASFTAIHHIKAIPKIIPLEFLHITQNDGNRVERAGAKAGVAWGACHYHHAMEKKMHCPDISMPELEGNVRMRSDRTSHTPWHSPLQDFMENPFGGRPTFAVVRNPYERLIGYFYCPWNGYKGDSPNSPKALNKFIQESMFPTPPPPEEVKEGEKTVAPTKPPKPEALKHLRPQYHYIFATDEIMPHSRPFVTHILHYETIKGDFEDLMGMYGLESKIVLPSDRLVTVTVAPQSLTMDDFSDASLRMIHRFYGKDFTRFNYKLKYVKPLPPTEPPTAPPTKPPASAPKDAELE